MRLSLFAAATLAVSALTACANDPCDPQAEACQEAAGDPGGKADGPGKLEGPVVKTETDGGLVKPPVSPPPLELCPTWTWVAPAGQVDILAGSDVYYRNPGPPPTTAKYAGDGTDEFEIKIPATAYTASGYQSNVGVFGANHLDGYANNQDPISITVKVNHWYQSSKTSLGAGGSLTVKDLELVLTRYANLADAQAGQSVMETVTLKAKGPFQTPYHWGKKSTNVCPVTGPEKALAASIGQWNGVPAAQDYYVAATKGRASIAGSVYLQ